MAVGARSGHGEPEKRPGTAEEPHRRAPAGAAPEGARSHATYGPAGPESDGGTVTTPGDDPAGPGGTAGRDPGHRDGPGDGAPGERKDEKKHRSFWKELPLLIGIALLLALLIKTFLVQAFSIPSESMQNTLQRGDRVLVDKLTPWFGSRPERGEVVVFHDPGGWLGESPSAETGPVAEGFQKVLSFIGLMPSAEEKDLIKRVIAVGGDTVECKGDNDPVVVNGKALKEPYVYPGNTPCGDKPFGPITVPKGRIWVMGDHRQDSLDSRWHQELAYQGTVSEDDVVGRAIVVAWPLNRWATLPVPDTFDQPGLAAAAAAAPAALGLAGAVPLVLWRRRRALGQDAPAASAGRPEQAAPRG
ncbi:signal peptidase I [Streptomyces cinnamoneus]|uniref:signal peptidase I n=1 Tax=Streptomyces cinnamoneus TaxID=53446 RepID=UPI0037A9A881